ncbi:MAG TPA: nickel-type superoxide dismutase maturation protease [Frankiaceae bacterium]|nr:nickel-type superoxide dismutase maturation protease [Frankiaceae bacterium]
MRLPWLRVAVRGPSMIPTLAPGEWVLVRRTASPRPGAVVLVRTPERLTVKRLVRLTEDGCWVEGDNPAASTDSRTYGAVPRQDVVGEVRWRYHPWRRAGRVR